ncbi:MAG: hypothetical protein IMW89_07010 [Ktedonobacteraceae bacterium]|nr:hypothetical protein [Ktedonobacteraceae bacterium]
MQEKKKSQADQPEELSEVWRELLGNPPAISADQPGQEPQESEKSEADEAPIPVLANDPWSELAHSRGTEVVDLQKIHLQVDDQEVEHVLEVMQEQSPPGQQERVQKTQPSD